MEAVCALTAIASMVWLPTPSERSVPGVADAWRTILGSVAQPAALEISARATAPRIEAGGLSLTLPREAVALRRAAQALGYTMPDPDAVAAPVSAQLVVDPQAVEFRTGTRVCVRYVARF